MACIEICGGRPLDGEVRIQGAKNAALPILAGTVLHRGTTVLHNCPKISDVMHMVEILEALGCKTSWSGNTLCISARDLSETEVPKELGKMMRCSIVLLGALLGRAGSAKIPYPGGCTIGARPIDMHVEALGEMGAKIHRGCEWLSAGCGQLVGKRIFLKFPSVGATENIILAAILARGTTELYGGAKEPEVVELCRFLNGKGARIYGAGTGRIVIEGVEELSDSECFLMPDRIVAGTYLMAAVTTGGCCMLRGTLKGQMGCVVDTARRMGAVITETPEGMRVNGRKRGKAIANIETAPYPGFPTDLQSQLLVSLCVAAGKSRLRERVFEARFQTAGELVKMGADIRVENQEAQITGVPKLHGAAVQAEELRGGAALVIAGAAAEGLTQIEGCAYINRGYEDICRDMRELGANIRMRG